MDRRLAIPTLGVMILAAAVRPAKKSTITAWSESMDYGAPALPPTSRNCIWVVPWAMSRRC
jgi:hypothetical protein